MAFGQSKWPPASQTGLWPVQTGLWPVQTGCWPVQTGLQPVQTGLHLTQQIKIKITEMCFSDSDDRFNTQFDYTRDNFYGNSKFSCIYHHQPYSMQTPAQSVTPNNNNQTRRRLHLMTASIRGLHLSSLLKLMLSVLC